MILLFKIFVITTVLFFAVRKYHLKQRGHSVVSFLLFYKIFCVSPFMTNPSACFPADLRFHHTVHLRVFLPNLVCKLHHLPVTDACYAQPRHTRRSRAEREGQVVFLGNEHLLRSCASVLCLASHRSDLQLTPSVPNLYVLVQHPVLDKLSILLLHAVQQFLPWVW